MKPIYNPFKNSKNDLQHSISKFQNKYYRSRKKEITDMNLKIVRSISLINNNAGKVSKQRLSEKRFRLPINNKTSIKLLQYKRIEEDNQVGWKETAATVKQNQFLLWCEEVAQRRETEQSYCRQPQSECKTTKPLFEFKSEG